MLAGGLRRPSSRRLAPGGPSSHRTRSCVGRLAVPRVRRAGCPAAVRVQPPVVSLAAKNTTGLEGVRVSSSRRRRHGARAHAREAPSHGRHGAVPCVYVAAGTAGPLGRAREQPPPINLCSTQPCRTMRIQYRRILGTIILDLELDSCARSTCHAFFADPDPLGCDTQTDRNTDRHTRAAIGGLTANRLKFAL